MSQAPLDASEDPTTARNTAFREANTRQQEMLRNGVSNSGHERNCCHLNTGTGRFANISAAAGLDHIGDGRAYAVVDWDHDGDVDLWATNRTGPRLQFLRNNGGQTHHFLAIQLIGDGESTNRDAIGARVEVIVAGDQTNKSIQTLRAGEGFLSQSSKWLHFGLGKHATIERVIIHWPGGAAEEFTGIRADQHYTISQRSGEVREWSRRQAAAPLVASHQDDLGDAGQEARIPLRYRIPLPTLAYENLDGSHQSLDAAEGSPTLLNLWASWCRPCLAELADFRQRAAQLQASGLKVLALSVDQLAEDAASNPQAARDILKRQEFPFAAGFATTDFVAKLEATLYYLFNFRRPWAVPSSFLLDARGQLAVIYIGPVDPDQLIADVAGLSLDDRAWLDASLPFAGRWLGEVRHPNLLALVETYLDRGFADDASRFVDKYGDVLAADPKFPALLVRLAASFREHGDFVQAARCFRQLIKADPDDAQAHLQLCKLLYQQQANHEAMHHAREAVRLQPDSAEAQFVLANLLQTQGNLGEAIAHFEQSVNLAPAHFDVRMALGRAYFSDQRWTDAIEQYRKAVEINPDDVSAHHQLALALQKYGRLLDALPLYRRGLALAPDNSELRYAFGTALAAAGNSTEAIRQFRQALERQPDSLPLLNGLAWLLATTDGSDRSDAAEAVQLAEQAAHVTSHSNAQILDTLAAAYAASGEFDKAVATAQQAMMLAAERDSTELAEDIRDRLAGYRNGKPYRDMRNRSFAE